MVSTEIRILITISSFYDGGAELFAVRLANALYERGYCVMFLELNTLATKHKPFRSLLHDEVRLLQPENNLAISFLRYCRSFGPGLIRKLIGRVFNQLKISWLKKKIEENELNIIHSHSYFSDRFFSINKRSLGGYKLISTFHGHYSFHMGKSHTPKDYNDVNYTLAKVDFVAYLSNDHWNLLKKTNFNHQFSQKIYNGLQVDIEAFITQYEMGQPLKLIVSSRAIREKGWEELILATKEIIEETNHALQIDFLGDGVMLAELKQRYGGLPYVNFHGHVTNVIPFIQNAHLGVLPSFYAAESLPLSVIEYLSQGKPVVSTDIGEIPDMLNHNREICGKLVQVENGRLNISGLKEAILFYLNNPDAVSQHSEIALNAYKKFSMEICLKNYLKVYQNLC